MNSLKSSLGIESWKGTSDGGWQCPSLMNGLKNSDKGNLARKIFAKGLVKIVAQPEHNLNITDRFGVQAY